MYSPKIAEELIPALYHVAKAQRVPMTKLVNQIIREALAREDAPPAIHDSAECSCTRNEELEATA